MGKSYSKELERLPEVYSWARGAPIEGLAEFVRVSAKLPMYVVGSGGSYTGAALATVLHQKIGAMSKRLTPLELLEYDNIGDCSILIVTAGGNNLDILAAFDKAVELKPRFLGVLCTSPGSKLVRRASAIPDTFVHSTEPPSGKDGFLATNSLLTTAVCLMRAYAEINPFLGELPPASLLLYDGVGAREFEIKLFEMLNSLKTKKTIVILHDVSGMIAALDAESKLVEAGLINVQISDYRNFAHGRHNWLDKNKRETGIVALVTPERIRLADKTIKLIPDYVPVVRLESHLFGMSASLNLMIKVLYAVKFFGDVRGIDPGRPGVAKFGSRIYHLSIPGEENLSNIEQIILQRKLCMDPVNGSTSLNSDSLRRFTKNLGNACFGGAIFDYDGTLSSSENSTGRPPKDIVRHLVRLLQHNIPVGIATGRGKSVREVLQDVIPKKYWTSVLVGYYNGADIATLDDERRPDRDGSLNPELKYFFEDLNRSDMFKQESDIDKRPLQISIQCHKTPIKVLARRIHSLRPQKSNIRIVESDHSIDILAAGVSKINLLNKLADAVSPGLDILCIGDKGGPCGNDYELLQTKYSLSVDQASGDARSCWNISPPNVRGEKATLMHLKNMRLGDGHFVLDPVLKT